MKNKRFNVLIAVALIGLAVVARLLPHPANFAPVAAVAIFGGAVLPKRLALAVPLLAMMVSDAMIGFHSLIPVTWGCYLLIAVVSHFWLRKRTLPRGIALTAGASLFFFVVTNFAVWLWSGMYAHTVSGLTQCFTLALPFFRNTALSDALYTAALFSIYELAIWTERRTIENRTLLKQE